MRSQTSSGRQNYHQILTQVELRNLSTPIMKRKDGLQRVKENQLQNLLKQTMTLTSSQKVSKVVLQENQGHFLEDFIFTKHVSQITPPAMKSRRAFVINCWGIGIYFNGSRSTKMLHQLAFSYPLNTIMIANGHRARGLYCISQYCDFGLAWVLWTRLRSIQEVQQHLVPFQRSTDLNMVIASPLLSPPLTELNTPATKTNGVFEFYNLLYVSNGNKDHSIVPPSRWATFDLLLIFSVNFVVAGADLSDSGHETNRDIQLSVAVEVTKFTN
ncbi:hypothetical protein Pint_16651 [Pistacia integerrima]|uniref:Uncharacterized protein n=1 Tax=Pistacia integerrima TaxID=434235 RepID=A0ACC0ZG84_9ROSI|nr:hypothetical protein Pint_16651 [Pistacia integerrima]